MTGPSSKRLPLNPNLQQLKNQAKELAKAVREPDSEAIERVVSTHPRFWEAADAELESAKFALADSQLVIAREYGFPSWPALKIHVETVHLDLDGRIAKLIESACSSDVRVALELLDAEPWLAKLNLCTAAVAGDAAAARSFLEEDPSLAIRNGGPNDWQPLLYLCFSRLQRVRRFPSDGFVEIAAMLLEHGADPNVFFLPEGDEDPDHRQTPLYGAAGIANNAPLTKLLIDAGADPNDGTSPKCLGGETLYHVAEFEDTECLRLVLECGPRPVGVQYCFGRALDHDNPDAARLYLEHGADPNYQREENVQSPFQKAIQSGRTIETIRLMIDHGADINAKDPDGLSPYRTAVRHGLNEVAELLREHGASNEDISPVEEWLGGCLSGDEDAIGKALESDPNVERTAREQYTLMLDYAAVRGNSQAVRRFLDAGIDIRSEDCGETLHGPCWFGHLETAKVLINRGAPLESVNSYGGTPLGAAIYGSIACHDPNGGPSMKLVNEVVHGDYPGIVEALLEAGAKPPSKVNGSAAVADVLRRYGVKDE
jgi:ankyrin repeat protein